MITSADFKKQISKVFVEQLKLFGFKGSGFNFLMDTENFIFTIGIQAGRFGGQCCVEFGIQPKSIDTNGFETLNFKKIKYYNCELRTRLAPAGQGDKWWKYSDNEEDNIQIANQIIDLIKIRVLPIIQLFKDNPNYLETFEPTDLDDIYKKVTDKLLGMHLATTEIRLSWALAKAIAKRNPTKAKAFAKYGLSKLADSDKFFGRQDLEKILAANN